MLVTQLSALFLKKGRTVVENPGIPGYYCSVKTRFFDVASFGLVFDSEKVDSTTYEAFDIKQRLLRIIMTLHNGLKYSCFIIQKI
jgi:hypothetical protein